MPNLTVFGDKTPLISDFEDRIVLATAQLVFFLDDKILRAEATKVSMPVRIS